MAMHGSMAAGQQEGSDGCRWVLLPCMDAFAGMPKIAAVPSSAPILFSWCARPQVFKLTSLAAVPAVANRALLTGAPEFEFTAYYSSHCRQVSFNSGLPAYYIAIAA